MRVLGKRCVRTEHQTFRLLPVSKLRYADDGAKSVLSRHAAIPVPQSALQHITSQRKIKDGMTLGWTNIAP